MEMRSVRFRGGQVELPPKVFEKLERVCMDRKIPAEVVMEDVCQEKALFAVEALDSHLDVLMLEPKKAD